MFIEKIKVKRGITFLFKVDQFARDYLQNIFPLNDMYKRYICNIAKINSSKIAFAFPANLLSHNTLKR